MTDYTCTNCNLQFSLPISGDDLRCPKCGQSGLAERLPEVLEEFDSEPEAAPEPETTPKPATAPAAKPRIEPRRAASGKAAPVRRSRDKAVAAPAAGGRNPLALVAAAVVLVGIGAAAYFMSDRSTSGSGADETSSATNPSDPGPAVTSPENAGSTAAAPPESTGDPRADFQARKARLAQSDLAGRKQLLEFCREHDLDDLRGPLLREILLLDSEDEVARRSFGFSRHDNAASPLHGRWLTKADAELAATFDALLAK